MSEMKQGYKQTDIGVIPEDWEVKTICDGIAEVKSGKRLPMGYYVSDTKSEHPYIRVIDMMVGGIDTSDIKYVPNEAYPPISNYRIFVDDIFISVAGTLGLVGKIPKELDGANLTENANRLTRINCNRDYLMYYLLSPLIQNVILSEQTIGAQPKLALNRIRNFQIGLPPTIQEQTAIATALSDTDALIAALDKKIAKKQQIKQGAMQQLLTGKKRLPGFSGEWVEKRVDEFSDTSSGGTPSRSNSNFYTGNIPWVTTGELNDGYISCTKEYISEEALNCSSAKLFPANTVLMAMYGATIGKLGIINIPASTNQACCAFLCDNQLVDNKFLFYKLRFIRNELISLGSGAGQPNISQTVIRNLSLCMPNTITEQIAIAQILTDMDNEIAQLEKERDKYKELKAGMMQVLLTGKVRLV